MIEYTKSEADGKFFLHGRAACASSDDDSLGRGGGDTISVFHSAEAREYFLQSRMYDQAAQAARGSLDALRRSLAECLTVSGKLRTKRLREIVGRAKQQLEAS